MKKDRWFYGYPGSSIIYAHPWLPLRINYTYATDVCQLAISAVYENSALFTMYHHGVENDIEATEIAKLYRTRAFITVFSSCNITTRLSGEDF